MASVPKDRVDGEVSADVPEQTGTFDASAGAEAFGAMVKPADGAPPAPEPEPVPAPEAQEPPLKPAQNSDESKIAFDVPLTLAKAQESGLGLQAGLGQTLRVYEIPTDGPILEYNAGAAPDRKVQVGDFIVGIRIAGDEVTTSQEMLNALGAGGEMFLSIRRPVELHVAKLDKKGSSLGLNLRYHPDSDFACVLQVLPEGAIPAHNAAAPREQQVRMGDYIAFVIGEGSAQERLQSMKGVDVVDFVIARPGDT